MQIASGNLYLYRNGVNVANLGAVTGSSLSYFSFTAATSKGCGSPPNYGCGGSYVFDIYLDSISTSGQLTALGTSDSPLLFITKNSNNEIDQEWTAKTIDPYQSNWATSVYTSKVTYVDRATLKNTTTLNLSKPTGDLKYNRSVLFGEFDYGLYKFTIEKDSAETAYDYLVFAAIGDSASLVLSSPTYVAFSNVIGTYSFSPAEFATYNYFVKTYEIATGAIVDSQQIVTASGTATKSIPDSWTPGDYYIVLQKITKSDGQVTTLAFDTFNLIDAVNFIGTTYNARNGTVIPTVAEQATQGAALFNGTSNTSGAYNISSLVSNIPTQLNASKVNYTHKNFSLTPPQSGQYVIDLYLFQNNITHTDYAVEGIVTSYPYHQAISGATVYLTNSTDSLNATTTATGYFIFTNLSNSSYNVRAEKTGYTSADNVSVAFNSSNWTIQNVLLHPTFTLTVTAIDATTGITIRPFDVTIGTETQSITIGAATFYRDYGIYTVSASATGYYPGSRNVLVDSNEATTVSLYSIVPPTDSTIFKTLPHDVKFVVQDIYGTTYPGVNVSVQGYNTTTGSGWTWLQALLGINFGTTPLNNASMSGNTGSDGAIVFKMMETVYYNIIVTGTNISNSYWLYPSDSVYYLTVSAPDYSWQQYDTPVSEGILTTVDKTLTGGINTTYHDILNQTTSLKIYVNNSDSTTVTSWACSTGCNNTNHNFTIAGYDGNSYFVDFVVVHTTYGNYGRSYSVVFPKNASLTGIPDIAWLFGAVLIMVFTGALFTRSTAPLGLLVICGEGWMFLGLGWFASMNTVQIGVGLSVATFMGIIAYIAKSAHDQGVP